MQPAPRPGTPVESPLMRGAVCIGLVLAASALTWLARPIVLPVAPFAFYFLAVLVTAFLCGTWPGLLATALSPLAIACVVGDPDPRLSFLERKGALELSVFLMSAFLASVLCGALHHSWQRAAGGLRLARESRRRIARNRRDARVSRERFRTLFRTAPVGILIARDGRVTGVNDAFLRLFGYLAEDEVSGRPVADFIMPDSGLPMLERDLDLEHAPAEDEGLGRRRDGSTFPFRISLSTADLGDGRATVGFVTDVTAQRQAEEVARENAERLQVALAAGQAGTWRIDLRGRTMTRGAALNRLLGFPAVATVAPAFALLESVHEEDRESARRALRAAIQDGKPYEMEYRIRRADGAVRWLRDRGEIVRDETGAARCITGAAVDVTELKLAELKLEQAMAQEHEARRQAEAANRAKDQFLAVLSHELRTPLTPVLMAAQALEEDPALPPSAREDVQMIRRNVELEARLIDDLLDVTRIANGKLRLQLVQTHVHLLVEHVLAMLAADLTQRSLRVELALEAEDDLVHADPARLQQVIWNIVKNAIKFSFDRGRIIVRTSSAGPRTIRLEVVDEGMGIEPGTIDRLFDAFEQGDVMVTRQFGGMGLGLAISKAIMDLHGGSIAGSSEGRGRGARFAIEMPTLAAVERMVSRLAEQRPPREGEPLRVLLVEDHPDTARMMQRHLRGAGIDAVTAGSVAAALALAAEQAFDVLVSDIGLPDASGLDLMRQIRDLHRIPGIAISGFGMEADQRASHEAGFSLHLTKPVDPDRLLAAIRQTVAATRPTATAAEHGS